MPRRLTSGLVSCAGKIEGRYVGDAAMPMQMPFRTGKVTRSLMGENPSGECWMGEGNAYVSILREEGLMVRDLNDDGSLQGLFGELKRKAK